LRKETALNMERAEANRDYALGLIAGSWLAKHDLTLNAESVEIEANEYYERAIGVIMIERSQFILGFRDGYMGYLEGII
jgi:hypothetical protein